MNSSAVNNDAAQMITVEVVYATPERQHLQTLQVIRGTTARQAVEGSDILRIFPSIDPATAAMGIFSRMLDGKSSPLPQDYMLLEGDRVEIYRPLQLDPKQVRLRRAARAKKAGKGSQNGR